MKNRLPDVIGIGTRRCGSSWLHNVLSSHPEIGKPPNGVHYFSQNYERGLDWYKKQLSPYSGRKLLLEFSVSYLYPEHCELAARNISLLAPEAKLFVCVRHPVQRAYSDYLRSIRMNEIHSSVDFTSAIHSHPELLNRSKYMQLLTPYLNHFPRDQVGIFFYEDLNRDPNGFAISIADFLGIHPNFNSEVLQRTEPKGKTLRSQWVNNSIRGIKGAIDKTMSRSGLEDKWSNWKCKHMRTYERILDLTHRSSEINKSLVSELSSKFHDDVIFLENLTGRNLKDWHG